MDLGQLVPVVLRSGHSEPLTVVNNQPNSKKPRRVYLSSRQGEDMCWAAESVSFVIDAGVQKKMASCYF